MKKRILRTSYLWAVLLLMLAACTQDELAEQGTQLPEGKYPLQIASITMDVTASEQPWSAGAPQTRVSENMDRNGSVWQNNDKIKVQIGNGTPGTYTYQDGSLTVAQGDAPAYWSSTDDNQTIRAWHTSSGNETVDLSNQANGLAYVLTASATANFNTKVSLSFDHALAKVCVKLTGEKVNDVKIKSYTSCTYKQAQGTLTTDGANTGEINMYKVDDNTYEANVAPGMDIAKFKVNGGDWVDLSTKVTPKAGKLHDITIDVRKKATDIDFSSGDVTISNDGNYRITGNHSSKNFTIQSPNGWDSKVRNTIILENTNLESIFLTESGARGMTYTTFIIKGNVNIKKGIVMKCGGEINIKGTTGSKLVITSPDSNNPAIGNLNCNSRNVALTIEDATIEATGSGGAAVIGTSNGWSGNGNVGDITIKNSNLMLTAVSGGNMGNPAVIGTGVTDGSSVSCGNITIYLKDGQSKEEFLQNLKGDYNQQVGVGSNQLGGSVSCGSISWYNSDGSPVN